MNIVELLNQRTREVNMAKARIAQPHKEEACIQWQMLGNDATNLIRYTDMKVAKKQFEALVKAADKNSHCVLSGSAATVVIKNAGLISNMFLIDVQANNELMMDTQRRLNAMHQLP